MAQYFSPQTDRALYQCPCRRPECDAPEPHPDLLSALDDIRDLLERPVIVTSGVRCAFHNAAVGGEADSEHVTGRAADIWTPTSEAAFEIVEAAIECGIHRIGTYVDHHVHIDVSTTKPGRVLWVK